MGTAILHPARSGGAGATDALPYLLARGTSRAPYYKRQIPRPLRPLLGCSTITVRLVGMPGSKVFFASYSRAHSEAERRISEAQEHRRLSAHEVLGVAGQWAREAGPQPSDTTYAEGSAALLDALQTPGRMMPRPSRQIGAWPAGFQRGGGRRASDGDVHRRDDTTLVAIS